MCDWLVPSFWLGDLGRRQSSGLRRRCTSAPTLADPVRLCKSDPHSTLQELDLGSILWRSALPVGKRTSGGLARDSPTENLGLADWES